MRKKPFLSLSADCYTNSGESQGKPHTKETENIYKRYSNLILANGYQIIDGIEIFEDGSIQAQVDNIKVDIDFENNKVIPVPEPEPYYSDYDPYEQYECSACRGGGCPHCEPHRFL